MNDDEIHRLPNEHLATPGSDHHQADKFHPSKPAAENQTTLIVDRAFLLRVLSKSPYMGPVKKKTRTGKRGPVPMGNQYTDAYDRRRNLYRLLKELPEAARLKESARLSELAALVVEVTPIKRKRLSALRCLVARSELPLVSNSTLQRYLKSAARNASETSEDV